MAVTINGTTGDSNTTLPGINWQSSIVTAATLTAVGNRGYWINTTSNICTITLPSSATVGDRLVFTDFARTWATNKIVIDSNGLNYQGNPDTITIEYSIDGQSLDIVYSGATKGWIPNTDEVTVGYLPPYNIDYLVIGGGGGGGGNSGGGGGGGGYRTSTQAMPTGGLLVTVAIGNGGAGSASTGLSGSPSQISGAGLTTISSAGGGGGSNYQAAGAAGGSGGGGGTGADSGGPGAGGAGNTPSTSPSQGNNGGTGNPDTSIGDPYTNASGGGGGGAGAVGVAGADSNGGNGGAGTASSITGSSVTRAGGGGGGIYNASGTIGSGGAGGGGAGAKSTDAATVGTVNTGGGGGGTGVGGTGATGGKGVVILSMPTASYSALISGSPTVTTSGANTILTFTGAGTYLG